MLNKEALKNIAKTHGRCGFDWYITRDTGGAHYLYVKDDKGHFSFPILMDDAILEMNGYINKPKPRIQPETREKETNDKEQMMSLIRAVLNTNDEERRKALANCHFKTDNIESLHDEDIITIYNTLKLKGYDKRTITKD